MVMFEGNSGLMPTAWALIPNPSAENIQFCQEEGEDHYPALDPANDVMQNDLSMPDVFLPSFDSSLLEE